jgi:hypothetical protein
MVVTMRGHPRNISVSHIDTTEVQRCYDTQVCFVTLVQLVDRLP